MDTSGYLRMYNGAKNGRKGKEENYFNLTVNSRVAIWLVLARYV